MNHHNTVKIGLLISTLFFPIKNSFADDWKTLKQQSVSAYEQGNYAQGIELAEKALNLAKQQYGEKDAKTIYSMINLAEFYRTQQEYDKAEPLLTQALTLSKQALGENHPYTVIAVNNLAGVYLGQGRYDLAEFFYKQGLKLNEKLGEKHPDNILNTNNLAELYRLQGRYELAESLWTQSLALSQAVLGENNPETISVMNSLGLLYKGLAQYRLAEPLLLQVKQFKQKTLGEKHLETLASMTNLALIYQEQGRYPLAESLHNQVWQLTLAAFGEKNPNTIASMANLAELYQKQGRYELAESFYSKAVALFKEVLGEKHAATLIAMNNLATLYQLRQRYADAETLYKQVFEVDKKTLGEKHPHTLMDMSNLAALYQAQQRYDLAGELTQQVLALRKEILGEQHPDTLSSLSNLAILYEGQHRYKEAEPLLLRAVQLKSHLLGESHPSTLVTRNALALLYQYTEQWDKAEPFWQENLRLSNQFLDQVLWGAGEKTRLAYLQKQTDYKNNYLSFYSFRNSPAMAKEGLYFSLTRKGQLLQISSEMNALAKNSRQADTKTLVEKFTAKKQQLANLAISGKGDKTQLQVLEEDINHLEMQLGQKLAAFRRSNQEITPDQVLAKLQPGQVVVDFLVFKEIDFKTDTYTTEKLIALVADKKQGVKLIQLGDMQPITEAVQAYRKNIMPNAMGVFPDRINKLNPVGVKLYQLVWQPLLPYLVDKKQVFLIPDGILHLLPFKALKDEQGRYLAQNQQITLLSSARDIVLPPLSGKTSPAAIFAAPSYDNKQDKAAKTATRNIAIRRDDIYFAPLEGAAKEGEFIRNLIKTKQPVVMFGAHQATETALHSIKNPRLLHFATHGFFLENEVEQKTGSPNLARDADLTATENIENALTRSGLALTGANAGMAGKTQADGTDGILTALEVLALDLTGTEVVTLSACETGVGDIQVGEGVYSLNRAFQEAGAKAVLSTLWSVADEQTNLFMQNFYSLILSGTPAQQALQQTQLKFIQQSDTKDPFFWAAFTVVGNN